MILLLDSQCLIWAVDTPEKLSSSALGAIEDVHNDRLVSMASVWEIAIKCSVGKLSLSTGFEKWVEKALTDLAARILPITIEHAAAQLNLPWHLRDPFDRLLIAQALVEGVKIVSNDNALDHYGLPRLW